MKPKLTNWLACLIVASGIVHSAQGAGATNAPITVASYYFGNYHPNDPRNEKMKGKGWSEWELVKAAEPRFPGHQQPKVPLWGCRTTRARRRHENRLATVGRPQPRAALEGGSKARQKKV